MAARIGVENLRCGIGRFLVVGIFSLTLTVSLLSGCATTEDVDMLRQDMNKLQREASSSKSELENLKVRTEGVAKEESFNVVRLNQAEIQSQLSNLAKDIQTLSGRFDENKYFVEKAVKDSSLEMDIMRAQITALERQVKEAKDRLNMIEGQLKQPEGEAERTSEESQKGVQTKAESSPMASSGKVAKYEAAYDAFKNKRYRESREKFEAFVKEFPKDELSDNAHFWVAETYYGEKDFEGAILAYETLLKKYPNSQKAPAALLKQGLSFNEIGDKKTGKVILEQLMERYPKSREAELAGKKLETLNKKSVKKK